MVSGRWSRFSAGVGVLLCLASPAWAQPSVDALRIYLGTSGSTCTLHSGTGAPSASLGAVCDTYIRTDSPYTIYSKTGASTWTPLLAVDGVATGSVLVSTGVGAQPAYSADPTVSTLVATGTNALRVEAALPVFRLTETDASADNGQWNFFANNETLTFSARGDAGGGTSWLTVDRTGTTVDAVTLNTSILQQSGYTSQTTAWGITDAGAADFRYLFTDELHARVFIADLEQALAGLQIITKSVAILQSDFTCPAAAGTATLSVEDLPGAADMQVFDTSDWVALRSFSRASQTLTIGDCVGQVSSPDTSPSGYQTWTFTRGTGGSAGSLSASSVIDRGAVVLDYGTSGAGYHEVNAVDGIDAVNSPYSQTVTWTTAPVAANRTVQTRIGNLAGTHGYSAGTPIFGAVFGPSSAANITIDPTNGIRIRNGTTNKIALDASGNASFVEGNTTLDQTGIEIAPTTALSDSRAYRFDVATGRLGTFAYDGDDEGRNVSVLSSWTGTGNHPSTLFTTLAVDHAPSSGGTASRASVAAVASGSTAYLNLTTSYNGTVGAGEIRLAGELNFQNDATTTVGAVCGYIIAIYQNDTTNKIRIPFYAANGGSCPTVP